MDSLEYQRSAVGASAQIDLVCVISVITARPNRGRQMEQLT